MAKIEEDILLQKLRELRKPFADNQISQLPKPTIALEKWKELPKARCKECGVYHATTNTIHLAYVGHAALTDRLLDVDPLWNWEAIALDANGYPLVDKDGGMWIRLTVCGITRLGYGDSQGKTGCNATKERIGDALRNAAMRFGAALELWHKGDLHLEDGAENKDQSNHAAAKKSSMEKVKEKIYSEQEDVPDFVPPEEGITPALPAKKTISEAQQKRLFAIAKKAGWLNEDIKVFLRQVYQLEYTKDIPMEKYDEICTQLAEPPSKPNPTRDWQYELENADDSTILDEIYNEFLASEPKPELKVKMQKIRDRKASLWRRGGE